MKLHMSKVAALILSGQYQDGVNKINDNLNTTAAVKKTALAALETEYFGKEEEGSEYKTGGKQGLLLEELLKQKLLNSQLS